MCAIPIVFMGILKEVIIEAERGRLVASVEPMEEKTIYLKMYNERLVKKLEAKMLQLENANRVLDLYAKEQATLHRIADTVARFMNMEDILSESLVITLDAMGCPAGAIYLLSEERGELVLQVHRGYPDGFADKMGRIRLGEFTNDSLA